MKDKRALKPGPAGLAMVVAVLFSHAAPQAVAQTPHQLEAHQHGHGSLNIAIDGQTLQVELEVPGSDIVGFEHAPVTENDKARVAAAKKKLAEPTSLFALPEEVGCRLVSGEISRSGGAGSPGGAQTAVHGARAAGQDDGVTHSEFLATYRFTCTDVDAIARIEFPYFDTFPNSEGLAVTLITPKGQKAFEVNRKRGLIDLQGLM